MDKSNALEPFSKEKGSHKLDKFKEHLVENKRLSKRDQETFEKMKKAWSLANKMFSPAQVVAALQTEYGHEKTHAYQILRDAYALWGDAYALDKRGLTMTLIEATHMVLNIAVREKDGENILKAVKQLTDLHKLNQTDNIIPPNIAMPSGTRVYVVNGVMQTPENDGKEVIDVSSEQVS